MPLCSELQSGCTCATNKHHSSGQAIKGKACGIVRLQWGKWYAITNQKGACELGPPKSPAHQGQQCKSPLVLQHAALHASRAAAVLKCPIHKFLAQWASLSKHGTSKRIATSTSTITLQRTCLLACKFSRPKACKVETAAQAAPCDITTCGTPVTGQHASAGLCTHAWLWILNPMYRSLT